MNEIGNEMKTFLQLSEDWNEYIRSHRDYVMKSGINYRTWTEIGTGPRYLYESYGRWMIMGSDNDLGFDDFHAYFWGEIDDLMVPVREAVEKYITKNLNYDDILNFNSFLSMMTSKVIKSISYGGTWKQMESFIAKEVESASIYNEGYYS